MNSIMEDGEKKKLSTSQGQPVIKQIGKKGRNKRVYNELALDPPTKC